MNDEYFAFLSTLEPETAILLLCAQTKIPADSAIFLQQLAAKDTDWKAIYAVANTHQVFPLVYKNLRFYLQDHIPEDVFALFKKSFQLGCQQSIRMTVDLEKCLKALSARKIVAVPFKGPVLAALYGDIVLRQFADIDVLVSRKDVYRAVQVLEELGYQSSMPLSEGQLSKLSVTDNEYPLYHPKTGCALDLQWELTGGYFANELVLADFEDAFEKVLLLNTEVSSLPKEKLLVYLCIHGNQHVWQKLDHVSCVHELIRSMPELDWSSLISTAKKLGAYRMFSIGVLLAHKLFCADVRKDVVEELSRDRRTVHLVDTRVRQILFPTHIEERKTNISHRFSSYQLKSLDSRLCAFKYLLRLVCIPTRYDWEVYPVAPRFSFLLYFLRPLRILFKLKIRLFLSHKK